MNAVVLHGIDDLFPTCVPVPKSRPSEVLLKVEANTICSTNLRITSSAKTAGARPGVILGHEPAGGIATVGEDTEGADVDMQATCLIVLSYGRYLRCLADREYLYENLRLFGYEINSGFAEYLLVPYEAMKRDNLVLAPCELEPMALTLAEPVSCYFDGVRQSRVNPGEAVVVLGIGPVRLFHVALTKFVGATRVVAAGHPGHLSPALALGATHILALRDGKLTREILDATDGGTDVVIVTAGDPVLANQVLKVAVIGRRINCFAGFPKGSTAIMKPNIVHYRELQVTGDSNARKAGIRRTVELFSSGVLDVSSLVIHRFPLT